MQIKKKYLSEWFSSTATHHVADEINSPPAALSTLAPRVVEISWCASLAGNFARKWELSLALIVRFRVRLESTKISRPFAKFLAGVRSRRFAKFSPCLSQVRHKCRVNGV